jgi:hypothetical protein
MTKVLILTLRHSRASEAFDSNQSTGCFSRIEKQFRRAGHVRMAPNAEVHSGN